MKNEKDQERSTRFFKIKIKKIVAKRVTPARREESLKWNVRFETDRKRNRTRSYNN